jgi:hypothetical protein
LNQEGYFAMQIKNLFDPSKDIYRSIEKVITYSASQEARLKAEISEYIITDSIEDQFESLLSKMQLAMETGGQNEIGVWVSGFYGSGKSSFTKYLGLALDQSVEIEGTRFLDYLQDRMNKKQTKALLATVSKRYPIAVVLLDLASEMLAGATMEDVSTVLYYKVLQWAGYSRNLKVAALERRLKKDGRYEELDKRIQAELGVSWVDVQNDPLVIDSLIPEIAHEMYPELFRTTSAFSTETTDFVRFENERVVEMIDIIRETTGKEHVLFIIDEVGQYIASRDNLILNLDGLAKNLKSTGDGKVWIIGTAQQTLTEDDPRAALNSPLLYKLSARFPIQIDLESKDIKEICYRRLLSKSPTGEKTLEELFEKHGQELRHVTRLEDARYYDADFDKTTFINLYPFLPAHFDILLHLLGALAKSTGGIGLRSAIKVIQDILIEGQDGQPPLADQLTGWLATTVTLYEALEKDIRRASPSIHKAVDKALLRFPDSAIHQEVAKAVAVLQILGNIPVTVQNIASLTHPEVRVNSRQDQIESAVKDLISDAFVPFGEKDGNLCFFSEKINDIDQERASLALRSIETRRIQNEGLREVFNPLPSTRLHGTLAVTAGLKAAHGSMLASLAGDRETIQIVVDFVAPNEYEVARTRLVDESRQQSSRHTIYLLGRTDSQIDKLVADIYRNQEIVKKYRNDPDQEVKDYCAGLSDRENNDLRPELIRHLNDSLANGSFIFRGNVTAVSSLDLKPLEAAKKLLAQGAGEVFHRYHEAPIRADTNLAEKFLRAGNLNAISSDKDPLGLVQITGGTPIINSNHKALISIKDHLDRYGSIDGKRLSEHFSDAPFGWSPDTLRYLVAVLLVNGEIKLKVSGKEIKVSGQQAIEGLRTNNAFKIVGISLRGDKIDLNELARAAERLTELIGDSIIPLEQVISKAAAKSFPQFQQKYGPLEEKLKNLGLPGADNVHELNRDLAEILETDASDVPERLGSSDSTLYNDLKWAAEVTQALRNGLEGTIQELREHWKEIKELPDSGTPGELKTEVEETLESVAERLGQDNFYSHATDLNTALTTIKTLVRGTVQQMMAEQEETIREAKQETSSLYEWRELTHEEQSQILAQLETLTTKVNEDIVGLKRLLSQEYTIQHQSGVLKQEIIELGHERRLERLKKMKDGEKIKRTLRMERRLTNTQQLEALIEQLQEMKNELAIYTDIEITIHLDGSPDE